MSLFSDNISNEVPVVSKVTVALQDIVDSIADKVNNHFGECRINPETFGIVSMNTFDTFWYELGLEIQELHMGKEKYKKYRRFCIQVIQKVLHKITDEGEMTEFEFSLITSFVESSNDRATVAFYNGYEIPLHAKINNYPNWP